MYQAAYDNAKAALAEAEANVAALALLEKRYRNLVKTNAVSRQNLDNAISDHGQARARIARARAELESAAINLGSVSKKSCSPSEVISCVSHELLPYIRCPVETP